MSMRQSEMYERSFQRPTNFFELSGETQWAIDKGLGILDWDGGGSNGSMTPMTPDERKRYEDHYDYFKTPKGKAQIEKRLKEEAIAAAKKKAKEEAKMAKEKIKE